MGFWVEKQKLQQKELGILPVGFATTHLEMIREPGRPVSQARALLAGQDEPAERGSLWSLSVSPYYMPVAPLYFVSFTFFFPLSLRLTHHCDRIDRKPNASRRQQVSVKEMAAGERVGLDPRRKGGKSSPCFHLLMCVSIHPSIYFSIGQLSARGVWGIRCMCVVCLCVQVCVCV